MSGIHSVFQIYMIRIRSYLRQYGSSGYETGAVRKRSISAFERRRFHRCTSNIAEDMSAFSLHSTEGRFRFATVIPSKSTALCFEARDFSENADFFQMVFEIGRRYKILNPERMRDSYGKLVYLYKPASFYCNPRAAHFKQNQNVLVSHFYGVFHFRAN